MDEEKKNESSAQDEEIDFELAKEAAHEASSEVMGRWGGIELEDGGIYLQEDLTDEERQQKIGEALKDMNEQVNEIYRRKKQERSK